MDIIQKILNTLISKNLPTINQGLHGAIAKKGLDPLASVTSGSSTVGSIDLGLCTATAEANYQLSNLRGLSSFNIDSLQITSSALVSGSPGKVSGTISLSGSIRKSLLADLSGQLAAGCGPISRSEDISGSVNITGAMITADGNFLASYENASVVLSQLDVKNLSVDYQNLSVNINGLGIFNDLLSPLEDLIIGHFRNDIRSLVARAITPVINTQLRAILPLSANM